MEYRAQSSINNQCEIETPVDTGLGTSPARSPEDVNHEVNTGNATLLFLMTIALYLYNYFLITTISRSGTVSQKIE